MAWENLSQKDLDFFRTLKAYENNGWGLVGEEWIHFVSIIKMAFLPCRMVSERNAFYLHVYDHPQRQDDNPVLLLALKFGGFSGEHSTLDISQKILEITRELTGTPENSKVLQAYGLDQEDILAHLVG